MIFIKGKMKKMASNQSEASFIENSLSKSALDRSSRSILDEYQKKFDDNQKVLQGYIDLLKELNTNLSKIGNNVEKQYDWLKNQDFIPSTPGGQEKLDEIEERLCQTMNDDGNGNPGCNVTLEQLCDLTCDKTDETTSCVTACETQCQTNCETYCQTTCETTTQTSCGTACEATTQTDCTPLTDESWFDTCEATADCSYYGDGSTCTSYGQDDWCGLLESNCETNGDKLVCISLGDYNGNTCYDVGETTCSHVGERYCTSNGEQYCNLPGEKVCLYPGEQYCLFEGEDDISCYSTVDIYMCENSADGPDACYDVGESNCAQPGEKYCRESGEKFFCFFYEDDACTSIADQTIYCKYYDDDSIPWCEQEVVDACNIPFKDCVNSGACPPEFGSSAGCDVQGCEAACNDTCIDTCDTNCFNNCNKSCLTSCVSACDTNCFNGCNKNCQDTCVSACDTSCFAGCDKNCEKTCVSSCDTTCFGTCVTSCDKTCFGTCISSCDKTCFSSCVSSCDSSCFEGCHLCESVCQDCLGSYCDSACYSGCDNECTGYSCNKTCDINFQCTGCDGTAPCMAACIPSQQTCTECGESGGSCLAGRWCDIHTNKKVS